MALGILAFTITALLGALMVGMNTDRESVEELQATHIMQNAIAERRAAPVMIDTNLLLPQLNASGSRDSSNPLLLSEIGRPVAGGQVAKFGLVYRITPNATNNSAAIYCALYWPGQASPASAQGRVEVATTVALQ
jgi:hypothetical protein